MLAALNGNKELCIILFDHGTNMNQVDNNHESALHKAYRKNILRQ